jgi:hypothetical protein
MYSVAVQLKAAPGLAALVSVIAVSILA